MPGTASVKTAVAAFRAGNARKIGNYETDGDSLFLFGNLIARKEDGKIVVRDAGFMTATTQRALSALGLAVARKAGQWIDSDGKVWNGDWRELP